MLLSEQKLGFKAHKLTELACQSVLRQLCSTLDDKQHVICVILDLAEAFDSLDRSILLKKLEHYGIRKEALK